MFHKRSEGEALTSQISIEMNLVCFNSFCISIDNRSGTSSNLTGTRKTYDFDGQRASQYRERMGDVKTPSDLCNGSDWDDLTQKIWAKFDERRQPQALYEKKILLWAHLAQQIKVNNGIHRMDCFVVVNHQLTDIDFIHFFHFSDNNATIQFVFGRLNGVWLRFGFIGR